MGDLSQRFEMISQGSPAGGPIKDGMLAKVMRAVVGGVALTATVVAGALMGSVLLLAAGVLALGGLTAGLYLRWKLRRIIREQAKQMGGMKPGEPFNYSGTYSGNLAGGRFQVFVQESGPVGSPPPAAEEPLDVEVLEKDES